MTCVDQDVTHQRSEQCCAENWSILAYRVHMARPPDIPHEKRVIFVSYRRDDTSGYAGRLQDSLADRRSSWEVFVDIDSISPGTEFDRVILEAVGRSHIMLVLVGPSWVGAGADRFFEPGDFVRREIAAGLAACIPVLPILLRDATLPAASAIPDELAPLLKRQAFRLRDQTWRADVDGLIRSIEALLREQEAARAARRGPDVTPTVGAPSAGHRSGDAERAGRCLGGSVAWFAGALLAAYQSGSSAMILGGLVGAFNAFLVTASLVTSLHPVIRAVIVLAASLLSSVIWQTFRSQYGSENGALCAVLITGFFTVPWQPIRLQWAALRTPHRGWRCTVGAVAWFVAAVVGYFSKRRFSTSDDSAVPLIIAGAIGGAVNGFLLGRVAENGHWSWRTGLWTLSTAMMGAVVWNLMGRIYDEPFIPAPILTGLLTGIGLARALPARHERVPLGSTWRGVIGALTFGVMGLLLSLSWSVLPYERALRVVVGLGMLGGVVTGLLAMSKPWSKRLGWTTALSISGGAVWGLFYRAYEDSFVAYAVVASATAAIAFHRLSQE